jgi:hypothetical protein
MGIVRVLMKQINNIFLALSIATISFSGCSKSIPVPVTERSQNVDPEIMKKVVSLKAGKNFDRDMKNSKYKSQKSVSLKELKTLNSNLYDLILPIAKEAQKLYKARNLPKEVYSNGSKWLLNDLEGLQVTLVETKSGKFNGRYSPFNNLLIINYDKTKVDENLAKFLIAHEFAHALALHVSEVETTQEDTLNSMIDLGNISEDVLINGIYISVKQKDVKNSIDEKAEEIFAELFTKEDLEYEKKLMQKRKGHFSNTALEKSFAKKQEEIEKDKNLSKEIKAKKLKENEKNLLKAQNLIGVNLAIPIETKLVARYYLNSGLEKGEVLKMLKNGVDNATATIIAVSQHPKDQELEADLIALKITQNLGYDVKNSVCERFSGNKPAGLLDSHPSYSDRRENLGCK